MNKDIRFMFPIDGDFLSINDGKYFDDVFYIDVIIKSSIDSNIYINDVKASFCDGVFKAKIKIKDGLNFISATDKNTNYNKTIKIYNLIDKKKHFSLSIDDNIRFLKDLNDNNYTSIFENKYLKMLKRLHDEFSLCIHLNLFYKNNDNSFDLSKMTSNYKDEFILNSKWLKMSFHALSEFPDFPYKEDINNLYEDGKLTNDEIIRFAGKECLAKATTIHFGSIGKDGFKILNELGYKILFGCFELDNNNIPFVSYDYSSFKVSYLSKRAFYKDHENDMCFAKIDRILNLSKSVDENLNVIKSLVSNHKSNILLMIHEQYFYEDYKYYIKDFERIISECAKYLINSGYTSKFIEEIIL